jgi:FkbM family methyltransferase
VSRQIIARLSNLWRASAALADSGATFGTILMMPVRRRFPGKKNTIRLRNGVAISAPISEPLVQLFKEVWIDRCYAPINRRLEPGDAIVDIGANVGVFSLWAASIWPNAKVFAVEPSPQMFRYLEHNVATSRLKNVTTVQAACSGRNGKGTLYRRGMEAMNTLYTRDNYGSTFDAMTTVSLFTLDNLFARYSIRVCRLLKLDCEGAEYEILFNASPETLATISAVSMEYHVGLNGHHAAQLEEFLRAHGFHVDLMPLSDEEGGLLRAARACAAF